MSNIYDEMSELLKDKDICTRHTYFQLRYFLIGKEPTHQARLWKCIRELDARKASIEAMQNQLLDLADKIELLDIQCLKLNRQQIFGDDLDTKEEEIKIRRLNRKKKALEGSVAAINKKIREAEEESSFLMTSYKQLEQKEALKPYEDFESQLANWEAKISQEIQIKILTGQPLDTELIKTTLSLDNKSEVKKTMIQMLDHNKQALLVNKEKEE